ncbi:hypothetical protein RDI58_004501 [Solanum bulbocastanum]|uniref:Uncharacterized protein n=1 Tax=Solanum bulbocastanum TaxID=147425 RepID=A0AAN8TYY9_SOLBU
MSSSVSPSLALASFDNDPYQIQQSQQEQHRGQVQPHQLLQQQQQLPQQPQTPQQQQKANSEEEMGIGPSWTKKLIRFTLVRKSEWRFLPLYAIDRIDKNESSFSQFFVIKMI